MRFHVLVVPNARRTEIRRGENGELRVALAAPATEGKANKLLLAFLAERLNVPKTSICLARGANGRHKVVEVDGLSADEVLARLL